jgi:hypothetical protein
MWFWTGMIAAMLDIREPAPGNAAGRVSVAGVTPTPFLAVSIPRA